VGFPPSRHPWLTFAGYGERVSDAPDSAPPDDSEPTLAYPEPRPIPYGSSPYAITLGPDATIAPAAIRRPIFGWADVWTALLGSIGISVLGVAAGFIWLGLAPRATAHVQGGEIGFGSNVNKVFAGADLSFAVIGTVAGLLCGVVGALVARRRGLAVSLAMAIGGTSASLIASWLGRVISGGSSTRWAAHAGAASHHYFIALIDRQFLLAWPLAGLVVTFLVALFTPDPLEPVEAIEPAPVESAPS
jgi:hypothetical protein